MASRLFFDPLVALRVAPLVSSTCTLFFAWDQHFFLSIFNHPEKNRRRSAPLLQGYFDTFFNRGVWIILGLLAASATAAIANLRVQPDALRDRGTFWWYAAGAALSAGHLAYVPAVAPRVQAIIEAKPGTDVNTTLDSWLTLNWRRMLTTDLGAWLAFSVAVVSSLRAD